MDGTGKPILQALDVVVHTDREVDIQRAQEVGGNNIGVTVPLSDELGSGYHLDGIIPASGCLQSQLARHTQQVLAYSHGVQRILAGGLESQLHLKFVVPSHLLLVVVIGIEGYRTYHRVVAFTTFVPVGRNVILQELEVIVA